MCVCWMRVKHLIVSTLLHYITTLFRELRSRDMCPMIIRFLMSTYCNQQLRVKWEVSFSNYVWVRNGVKQGGVLSPILFNVCCLIPICWWYNHAVPFTEALNCMIQTCKSYAHVYNILFNANKPYVCIFTIIWLLVKNLSNSWQTYRICH